MLKTFSLLLLQIVVFSSVLCFAQASDKRSASAEKELRDFYAAYAEDLSKHRPAGIAERYDRRGVYLLGNGRKSFQTFESLRERYLTKWTGPKSFAWKDLSFEILSPTVAVVIGKFVWETEEGSAAEYSYTGVLIKLDGRWRIRVEDESESK